MYHGENVAPGVTLFTRVIPAKPALNEPSLNRVGVFFVERDYFEDFGTDSLPSCHAAMKS